MNVCHLVLWEPFRPACFESLDHWSHHASLQVLCRSSPWPCFPMSATVPWCVLARLMPPTTGKWQWELCSPGSTPSSGLYHHSSVGVAMDSRGLEPPARSTGRPSQPTTSPTSFASSSSASSSRSSSLCALTEICCWLSNRWDVFIRSSIIQDGASFYTDEWV